MNVGTLIESLNSLVDKAEEPQNICERDKEYIDKDLKRMQNTFSDQEAGLQIQQLLSGAIESVNRSEDLLISAVEEIKRIIQNVVSK